MVQTESAGNGLQLLRERTVSPLVVHGGRGPEERQKFVAMEASCRDLGLMDYKTCWELQQGLFDALVARKAACKGATKQAAAIPAAYAGTAEAGQASAPRAGTAIGRGNTQQGGNAIRQRVGIPNGQRIRSRGRRTVRRHRRKLRQRRHNPFGGTPAGIHTRQKRPCRKPADRPRSARSDGLHSSFTSTEGATSPSTARGSWSAIRSSTLNAWASG